MTIQNPEFPAPDETTVDDDIGELADQPVAGEGLTEAAGVPLDEETARVIQPEPVDE